MDATEAINQTMRRLEAAWNSGDAQAFGALHSVDATYVAFDGSVLVGPGEIAAGHDPLFRGIMRGSTLRSWNRQVRLVSADVAVVTQKGGIIMRWQRRTTEPSSKRISVNTTVLVRHGELWLVTAFQNTRYKPWAETPMGRLVSGRRGDVDVP